MSPPPFCSVCRIVSGGQTGVDRGALDAAMRLGLEHGGWCPRGRLAEDGVIPTRYLLQESHSPEYRVRTEQNVTDSDGTLILYRSRLQGGTELTWRLARQHGRPQLRVDLTAPVDPEQIRDWLGEHSIRVLNVAGPRESSAAGIAEQTCKILEQVLSPAATPAESFHQQPPSS